MKSSFFALLLIISNCVKAEIGYKFEGDLNGDGVNDTLESGPHYLFGANGAGPILITLSNTHGEPHVHKMYANPASLALEKHENGNLLWSYSHGVTSGVLFNVSLDGKFTYREIKVNGGVSPSTLTEMLLDLVFSRDFLLKLIITDPYIPPMYSWEK